MSTSINGRQAGAATGRPAFSTNSVRLAWLLAFAYTLVVAYVSLQPFQVWRMPPREVLHFLTAPWPRYITFEDLAVNVAAYLPLGFLLSIGCGARLGAARGVIATATLAAALSLTMESLQMFQPSRIASNVDLLTNGVGGLIGAMSAPLVAPGHPLGRRLHEWRHRKFRHGLAADAGFVLVCLWLVTQMNPVTQLFGTGAVRATFELPVYFGHTPQRILSTEALVVLLNFAGLGLIMAALAQRATPLLPMFAMLVGGGCTLKTVAAALAGITAPLHWLTPGVAFGLCGGYVALILLVRLPRRARLATALLCVLAATAAINLAPDNPYQNIPARLIAGGPSHYLSFSAMVRALSELWPVLAVLYLAYALSERQARIH